MVLDRFSTSDGCEGRFSTWSGSMGGVWMDVDHQAAVWCNQVRPSSE